MTERESTYAGAKTYVIQIHYGIGFGKWKRSIREQLVGKIAQPLVKPF